MFGLFVNEDIPTLTMLGMLPPLFAGGNIIIPSKININIELEDFLLLLNECFLNTLELAVCLM